MIGTKIGEDLDELSANDTPRRRTPHSICSDNSDPVDEIACRICMEGTSESHPLIHPCKCSGSVKHIHEECLKTWISSHAEDIDKSACEICKTPFVMEVKMIVKCSPREALDDGMTALLFTPLLVTVFVILIVITYLLIDTYLPDAEAGEDRNYTIALIVACLVGSLVILALIANSCKAACTTRQVSSWCIMSQEFREEDREIVHHRDDISVQLDQQNLIDEVLIVPKTIKFKGRKVQTPDLKPCLPHLQSASSSMAFATPRTYSLNVTPLKSRVSSIGPLILAAKVQPEGRHETSVI